MKKFWENLDQKYLKIAAYSAATVIITVVIIMLLYASRIPLANIAKLLKAVLTPLLIGLVLAYLFYPVVKFLERKLKAKWPQLKGARTLSVVFTLLFLIMFISLFLILIISMMTNQISQIDFKAIIALIENAQADAQNLTNQILNYLASHGFDVSNIGSIITGWVTGTTAKLSTFFFGVIFAVYFLIDGHNIRRYWEAVVNAVLPDRTLKVLNELLKDADACFSGYIRGQSLDAVLVGTVTSLVFVVIGMPYGLLIGLIVGVGNLIPYVGPILGYAAVILVNLVNGHWGMMLTGLALLIVIMFIDGNLINPKLLANSVKVHPLVIVASLLAGGTLGGVLGMLIAVPVGAFLKLQFEKWLIVQEKKNKQKAKKEIKTM